MRGREIERTAPQKSARRLVGGGFGKERGWGGEGRWRLTVCGDGPGHADFSVTEGEDFCAVSEGDGAFAWGVKGRENENEQGDESNVRSTRLIDE